ncbi:MAG: HIT family protein [Actinomycetota bacterium]|nr:HIT family protein [Actinomycetota bacterium]
MDCVTCRALAGEVVLTNAPRLDLDDHWRVEHVHPVAIPGWLVLVLRRHARAVHELTDDEALALGTWLPKLCSALHTATGCASEYVAQFAEGDGFQHVHFHLVARMPDWPTDLRGLAVFNALRDGEPIDAATATAVIDAVGAHIGVTPTPVRRAGS